MLSGAGNKLWWRYDKTYNLLPFSGVTLCALSLGLVQRWIGAWILVNSPQGFIFSWYFMSRITWKFYLSRQEIKTNIWQTIQISLICSYSSSYSSFHVVFFCLSSMLSSLAFPRGFAILLKVWLLVGPLASGSYVKEKGRRIAQLRLVLKRNARKTGPKAWPHHKLEQQN